MIARAESSGCVDGETAEFRNLVSYLGSCIDGGELFLVYEHVAGGSLKERLFSEPPLTWKQKFAIALDVASAISYLHDYNVIHADLNLSNILLLGGSDDDDDVKATVTGYCLVRTDSESGTEQVTAKTDIHAFGIVLLELLAGRQVPDAENRDLATWFGERHRQCGRSVTTLVGQLLNGNAVDRETLKLIKRMTSLGLRCTSPELDKNIEMQAIDNSLRQLAIRFIPPTDEESSDSLPEFCRGNLADMLDRWEAGDDGFPSTSHAGSST